MKKVFVVGLDCAPPEIVFNDNLELPVLKKLRQQGLWGRLRSSDPPITIPAWMVMATGLDSGQLGLYGFRHRKGYSYKDIWIANSLAVRSKKIWDFVGENGGQSSLVSIPPTYPPYPVHGHLISCFITPPGTDKDYTYPSSLRKEIEQKFGPYLFDVVFRTQDRDEILRGIYEMTEQRFQIVDWLAREKVWDFFMFVEIGLDRMHHAFWKFMDREHHLYEPGNKYETAIFDYYRYLDGNLGKLLEIIGKDTAVLVVSDHGAKRMKGAFCVNDWLIDQGYLVVRQKAGAGTPFEALDIDWQKTKAWAWGGYYARIFLNVEGREPQGIISPDEYEKYRDEITCKIEAISGPNGESWATKIIKPQEHFAVLEGDYPDLMVYFDDLYWRSAGTLGYGHLYLPENDTGPDDAVHDYDGIYILYNSQTGVKGERNASILDIAPTILDIMNIPVPANMQGRSLIR